MPPSDTSWLDPTTPPEKRIPPPGERYVPRSERHRFQAPGWGKLWQSHRFEPTTETRRAREDEQKVAAHYRDLYGDGCFQLRRWHPDEGVPYELQRLSVFDDEGHPGPRVCLTRHQLDILRPGRKLGCGSYGCGYERNPPDGTVVKFTTDPSDMVALHAGQGHRRVVPLLFAYRLDFGRLIPGEHRIPIYAAITQQLETPRRGTEIHGLANALARQRPALRDHYRQSPDRGTPRYRLALWAREEFLSPCKNMADTNACIRFGSEVIRLHEHLGRRGLNFHDVHPGNVGINPRTHEWQFLDVGHASDEARPPVPRKVRTLRGR